MPRDRLKLLVAGQPEAAPRLPYTHTTDVHALVNALDDGFLDVIECDTFPHEHLLYFFYGRPSYRPNPNETATSLSHYLPVCFIFRPDAPMHIKRILPFDSGAFERKLYSDAVHRRMTIEDFLLDVDSSSPGRLVSLVFGDTESYLRARARPTLDDVSTAELEAHSIHAIAASKLSNAVDNRGSGIEIQVDEQIDIEGNVLAVILPSTFLDGSNLVH